MYTIILDEGIVINTDGSTVSPAQSVTDPLFVEYQKWIDQGNEPIILVTRG